MKELIAALILFVLAFALMWYMAGCTTVIIEQGDNDKAESTMKPTTSTDVEAEVIK